MFRKMPAEALLLILILPLQIRMSHQEQGALAVPLQGGVQESGGSPADWNCMSGITILTSQLHLHA